MFKRSVRPRRGFDGAPAFEGPGPVAGFVHWNGLEATGWKDDLNCFELHVVGREAVDQPGDGGERVAEVSGGGGRHQWGQGRLAG